MSILLPLLWWYMHFPSFVISSKLNPCQIVGRWPHLCTLFTLLVWVLPLQCRGCSDVIVVSVCLSPVLTSRDDDSACCPNAICLSARSWICAHCRLDTDTHTHTNKYTQQLRLKTDAPLCKPVYRFVTIPLKLCVVCP